MNFENINVLHAAVIIGELAKAGAKRAVISPGSRSTALATAAVRHPKLQTYTILDERSAAFFALGLSKADGVPAILICTSGTAGANYYPAVIEASRSGVPLLLLTADRPTRLRHTCALQTIDQTDLYGRFTSFFADVPEAELNFDACFWVRSLTRQSFEAAASFPSGPAHLNVPLDEPAAFQAEEIHAAQEIWERLQRTASSAHEENATPAIPAESLERTRQCCEESLCGLIVAGPDTAASSGDVATVFHLARKLGWPLLADVTSGLRFFDEPALPFYDIFLRMEDLVVIAPDVVLHFGGFPTSKALARYLDRHPDARAVRVSSEIHRGDPLARDGWFVEARSADFCEALSAKIGPSRDSLLLEPFQRASRCMREELARATMEMGDCEAGFMMKAVRSLPTEANIIFASSLPIRYGDALLASEDRRHDVFSLRGVSGIDGTISHAAGIAAASRKPTLLVCGDLAFLHDLTGLIAATRFAPNLTILLLDNNGGGIFHFLPALKGEDHALFEAIHGAPHGLDLSAASKIFGVEFTNIEKPSQVREAMDASATQMRVLHVRSSRERNHAAYSALIERLKKACLA